MQEAIEAVSTWGNVTRAALELGIPRCTLQNRHQRALAKGLRSETVEPVRLPQTADECWAFLDAAIGRTAKPHRPPKYSAKDTRRIVVAGDFHAPFHDVEAVGQMLHETEGFDQLIVNGDLMDHYSISRFTKYESVAVERELAAVDALMGAFSRQYPDVLVVEGNHDRPRFEKQLRSLVSLEMIHVLEFLTGGEFSAIRALGKRYKNVRFADVQVGRHHLGWFAQEGDLLVAHAEKFSTVPGAALRVIESWFADRHDSLGLAPWKVLIQAHTHQLGWFPWHSETLLVEGGCLCETHGYQLDPKIAGRPQRVGYVTLTQHKGVTDRNSVRCHWIDASRKAA
jgi:predicted phosphodiesterase